jgi:asparagine synthase (glutamine-hydrolysing)
MPERNIFKKISIPALKKEIPNKGSLKNLNAALLSSILSQTKKVKKAAVLFSGGVDSSLVALLIPKKVDVVLFTVGVEGCPAFKRADECAAMLNLPLVKKTITESDLKKDFKKVLRIIKINDYVQLSIALPLYFAMKEIKHAGLKTVFCGQGADELFFGYDEFRRSLDFGKNYDYLEALRFKKIKNLWKDNLRRDFAVAKYFGLKLKAPYLDKNFVIESLAFSAAQNITSKDDFLRKRVLRKLAISLKLPKKIASEKKKAIQYDSGISRSVSKLQ